MKIRPIDVVVTAIVLLAVGGGVWEVMSLDAGMSDQPAADYVAPAQVKEPRADLRTAIPEAIRLVEAKDYVTLFREFVPPNSAHITAEDFDRMIKTTPEASQAMVKTLLALRSVNGKQPQMDPAGTRATFPVDPNVTGRTTLAFLKINGLWYMQD